MGIDAVASQKRMLRMSVLCATLYLFLVIEQKRIHDDVLFTPIGSVEGPLSVVIFILSIWLLPVLTSERVFGSSEPASNTLSESVSEQDSGEALDIGNLNASDSTDQS
jgi:hypothetical protein